VIRFSVKPSSTYVPDHRRAVMPPGSQAANQIRVIHPGLDYMRRITPELRKKFCRNEWVWVTLPHMKSRNGHPQIANTLAYRPDTCKGHDVMIEPGGIHASQKFTEHPLSATQVQAGADM
jgi:hypothetical protein